MTPTLPSAAARATPRCICPQFSREELDALGIAIISSEMASDLTRFMMVDDKCPYCFYHHVYIVPIAALDLLDRVTSARSTRSVSDAEAVLEPQEARARGSQLGASVDAVDDALRELMQQCMDGYRLPQPNRAWVEGKIGLIRAALRRDLARSDAPAEIDPVPCDACGGAGTIAIIKSDDPYRLTQEVWPCGTCRGTGVLGIREVEEDAGSERRSA